MEDRRIMKVIKDPFRHGPKSEDINRMVHVLFTFADGTKLAIENPKAATLFQARCNALGLLVGLEETIVEYIEKPWWRKLWR